MSELKEGMYIRLVGSSVPTDYVDNFYEVVTLEPLEYTFTFSAAVASGAESGFENVVNLEPDTKPFHLYFVTWGIKDGCAYQIKIPTGTNRLGVDDDDDVARITNIQSPHFAHNPTFGFYLIHDLYPAINAINSTPVSLTPKAYFEGFKYNLDLVTDDKILKRLRNFDTRETPYLPSKKITLGGIT